MGLLLQVLQVWMVFLAVFEAYAIYRLQTGEKLNQVRDLCNVTQAVQPLLTEFRGAGIPFI